MVNFVGRGLKWYFFWEGVLKWYIFDEGGGGGGWKICQGGGRGVENGLRGGDPRSYSSQLPVNISFKHSVKIVFILKSK